MAGAERVAYKTFAAPRIILPDVQPPVLGGGPRARPLHHQPRLAPAQGDSSRRFLVPIFFVRQGPDSEAQRVFPFLFDFLKYVLFGSFVCLVQMKKSHS